ncbi:FkbM family methyltransferase [Kineosporia sp. J2-2]|uniref:FkbM family methyltransferase n=1 Tax=Kineosporia corallincola TaxID=2835133 RepID=A0ABS5TRS2_9ACTN|nr:FkbM family methyltransferase [Kineosporia corallincola]MBT0773481.1 FkbM family methyltransferase [Kineosporia corallincola]
MTDERISRVLEHPAVEQAAVADPDDGTVHVVADPERAPLLRRAGDLELPPGVGLHEPAPDLLVAGVNRTETEFLHREVWQENAYLRHGLVVPRDAVVVDIGSNIGLFSLLAGTRAPGARIVAVEPMAETAAAATTTGRLHGLDLTVVTEAAGDHPGSAELTFYPGNTVMSGRYAEAGEDQEVLHSYLSTDPEAAGLDLDRLVGERMRGTTRTVPVTTVTELVTRFGLPRIDLLKIDVEKAEWDVLTGVDAATWPAVQQVALEVHDLDDRLNRVLALLRSQGFLVAHERDPRLVGTPLYTVYARRPGARPAHPFPAVPPAWPTSRALAADLRARLGGSWPARVNLVPGLDRLRSGPVAARTAETAVLAEIWDGIFGAGAAATNAGFFELGGTSLTAVRLIDLVEGRLGEGALEPDTVFTANSFTELAAAVRAPA